MAFIRCFQHIFFFHFLTKNTSGVQWKLSTRLHMPKQIHIENDCLLLPFFCRRRQNGTEAIEFYRTWQGGLTYCISFCYSFCRNLIYFRSFQLFLTLTRHIIKSFLADVRVYIFGLSIFGFQRTKGLFAFQVPINRQTACDWKRS